MKTMKARYAGKCVGCNEPITRDEEILYDPECKAVWHPECHRDRMDTKASPVKPVQAGVTARYRKPSACVQASIDAQIREETESEQPTTLVCVGCGAEFEGKADFVGMEQKDCICAACFERGVTPKRKLSKAALDAAFRIINDVPKPTTARAEQEWVAERVQKAIDVEAAAIARAHYSVHAKAELEALKSENLALRHTHDWDQSELAREWGESK